MSYLFLELFDNVYKYIEEKQIKKISTMIEKAEKIVFITEGSNIFFLKEFSFKLKRINKVTLCPSENHDKFIHVNMLEKNDLCFVLSLSGTTKSTFNLVNTAKKSKCKMILITTNAGRDFSYFNEVIHINTEENIRQMNNMQTRLAIISILDLLYLNVLNSNFDDYSKLINKNAIRNMNWLE